MESSLEELLTGRGSGSNGDEVQRRFGPERLEPVSFAMWLLLVLT